MNIIKWTSGKIDTPGVYDIPIEIYHSDICSGPSISSSGLRTIDTESPEHYWDQSYLNPVGEPQKETEALIFGRAAHALLLGESNFKKKFVIRPEELAGRAWQGNRTECKEWVKDQTLPILTNDDLDTLRGMAARLARHPLIQAGLMNGEIERSMFWKDKETQIWLKVRPDVMPVNLDVLGDYKTTADASRYAVRRDIYERGYHLQLALAGMGMEELMGRRPGPDDYVLIFQEKKRPYSINIKPLDAEAIAFGRMQLRRAIRVFADCWEKQDWYGYDDDEKTASLPGYAITELKGRLARSELRKEDAE